MERFKTTSVMEGGRQVLESLGLTQARMGTMLLLQAALNGCVESSNSSQPVLLENSVPADFKDKVTVEPPENAKKTLILKPISAGIPPEEVALGQVEEPPTPPVKDKPKPRFDRAPALTSRTSLRTQAEPTPVSVPSSRVNLQEKFFADAEKLAEAACWIPPGSNLSAGSSFDLNLYISNPEGKKLKVVIETTPPLGTVRELTIASKRSSSIVNFSIPESFSGRLDFVVTEKKDNLSCSRLFFVVE